MAVATSFRMHPMASEFRAKWTSARREAVGAVGMEEEGEGEGLCVMVAFTLCTAVVSAKGIHTQQL